MAEDLTVGAVIAGRYRLERLLAEGGMGVVWAAKHVVTRKPVALKFVKGEAANDERTRRRLLREARAACAVQHPNVVAVHDVMELASGSPVLVMDLLKGESLRAKLDRQGKIPLHDLANILIPVVSAVGTAHSCGVVHRDLKPENIFLAQMPGGVVQVKVLDFGIAKLTSAEGLMGQSGVLTGTGLLLGTPDYMSVEQILGEEDVDHRADIWALGIVLYECLRGQRPTAAENVGKVLKIILTNAIPPIQLVMPALPDDIKNLIMRMIALDRAARPSTLLEVGRVLERYGTVPLLPFDPPRARSLSEAPTGPPIPLPSTKIGAPRAASDGGVRTLVPGSTGPPGDDRAAVELADTKAARPPSSSRPLLAERAIMVSPALLGREPGDAGMPIALDEPFAMDSIASDRQLTMSNKGLTLGDLLSPDELAMLGERLERAQSDAPEERTSPLPDSSGEPPISVSEFLPPSLASPPLPSSMATGPVSSEDPVTLVAGRALAPADLQKAGLAADPDARPLGDTLPFASKPEGRATLPFSRPTELRAPIPLPQPQPSAPSTPHPSSRLSFSDRGGSRDFPPRLFPSGPTFDGLPSRGPATTRSTEVQTPHTTTAPAPASTPMPAGRAALRYVMIGGLACGAFFALWLLMKPPPRPGDMGTTGTERLPTTPPTASSPRACPQDMILIPGDTFAMGAAEGRPDERPVHDVRVETFCMDRSEVTGADYQRCVDQNQCDPPKEVTASTTSKEAMTSADRAFEGDLCQDPKRDGAKNLPINCVSWAEANSYCRVQGKRLPTEEEWEFTARGGAELRRFPWGTAPPSAKLVNACGRECADLYERLAKKKKSTLFKESDGQPALAPVGSFPGGAARYGNHDMAGNVWEWTASTYCTYPSHSCSNPSRVFRGGSFTSSTAASVSGTTRMAGAPENQYMDVGFRCAKDKG